MSDADTEPKTLRATYAGAKRRIAALEQQIVKLQEAGSQRKESVPISWMLLFQTATNDPPRRAVSNVTQGRIITRLVSFFETVEDLVSEGDRRRAIQAEGFSEDEDEPTKYTLE